MECASWIAVAFRLNHRLSSPQRFSRCSAIAPTRRTEPETADENKSGGNAAAALHTLARTSLAPGVVGRASVWSAPAGSLSLSDLIIGSLLLSAFPDVPRLPPPAEGSQRLLMRAIAAAIQPPHSIRWRELP